MKENFKTKSGKDVTFYLRDEEAENIIKKQKSAKMWGVFARFELIQTFQFKWIAEDHIDAMTTYDHYETKRDNLKVRPVTVTWEED